jgi:methionine-rich copper-binding protein CopC
MRVHAFIGAALLLGVATVQAHVRVESIKPADRSRVKAPAAIELGFSEPAYLAELTLQHGKEPVQKLKLPTAEDSVVVAVPLPPLAAGTYVVTYRVESDDGHATNGKFSFTVDPAAPAAQAKAPAQQGSPHDDMHHDSMPHDDRKHGAGKDSHP